MRLLVLLSVLAMLACFPAIAGKNAGGALVVHTDDSIQWSWDLPEDYFCSVFPYSGEDCEELNPTSGFIDPGGQLPAIVYYVAAFPLDSTPGVTAVYFGHDHSFSPGFIGFWSPCGPENTFEIPDAGWPVDTNAGNTVVFGSPIADDRLFPFYNLGPYGDFAAYIGPRIHPTDGYAGFISDDTPGELDEVHLFGTIGWFGEGENQCPGTADPEGACCFGDGSCQSPLTEATCFDEGGSQWIEGEDCADDPCPPVATEQTTWGMIKTNYE